MQLKMPHGASSMVFDERSAVWFIVVVITPLHIMQWIVGIITGMAQTRAVYLGASRRLKLLQCTPVGAVLAPANRR